MNARAATLRFYSSRLNAVLAALIALMALLYGTFLLLAVVHAASRAEAARESQALTERLAPMQARYLALEQGITPERALSLGLVKPAATATVFAQAEGPAFSLGNDR